MNIITYIHPIRTYLPCTGVGRHINNIVLGLASKPHINVKLLFSEQWLGPDGKLDPRSPLRDLPQSTFPMPENQTERKWKLFGYPSMESYLSDDIDWVYAPVETYLPLKKAPVAITIHDIQAFETNLPWSHSWSHRWFRYKWGRWVKRALQDCRIVFTVSEFSKQRMVELLGANPQKIVVSGNGVDQSFFEIASINPATLPHPFSEPYTLIIGGLRYKKGADYVLQVAQSLKKHKSDIQIVVIGETENKYLKQASQFPNVHLLGMVSDQELPYVIRGASSLMFLSLYEGFGIPALEAMAAGIPVVVSNRGSLPEITCEAALVVEPEATDEIVNILTHLYKDNQLRETYREKGQHRAAQYTWDRCVNSVLVAFEKFS